MSWNVTEELYTVPLSVVHVTSTEWKVLVHLHIIKLCSEIGNVQFVDINCIFW